MPGTGSVTSRSITEMIASIHGHVWQPHCTKDVDKLERIQDGAARRGKDALKQEPEVIQSVYFHKKKVQNDLITVHKYLR